MMRLNLSTTPVLRGGKAPIKVSNNKTTLNNTIFKIVTEGLYIRPIDAIVRELCTNALDSHIEAGKPEVPFKVTYPTRLNPYFIVRDFGVSMTQETLFDIYGVLGESTKNSTSNAVGGWGVGGKSPAAYTNMFFITTYLNKRRSIYQSSVLEHSNPLELMLEGASEEPQGVEIKVPVQEKDFDRFHQAISTQLAMFDVKPIITNLDDDDFKYACNLKECPKSSIPMRLVIPNNEGILTPQTVDIDVYQEVEIGGMLSVRMGCVLYPINASSDFYQENKKTLEDINKISKNVSFMFDLPVDAVDIKPSREDLNYTNRTVDVLQQCLHTLKKDIFNQVTRIAWQLRALKPEDILFNEYEKFTNNKELFKYVLQHYKAKSSITSKRYYYWSFVQEEAEDFRRKVNKEADLENITFKICDGDSTFNQRGSSYGFIPADTITIIKKCTAYIKRTEYAMDNDLIDNSGLGQISRSNTYHYASYFDLDQPKVTKTNRFIVANPEQLDKYETLLKKFYKNVVIFELPKIPKESIDIYKTPSYSRTTPTTEFIKINSSGDYTSHRISGNYNFKLYNEIIDNNLEIDVPLYQVLLDKDSVINNRGLLEDLCKYFKAQILIIRVTDGYKDRLLNKYPNTFREDTDSILNELLNKIPSDVKDVLIKEFYKTHLINELFSRYSDNRITKLSKYIFGVEATRDYFFGFLPKAKKKKEFQFLSLTRYLFTDFLEKGNNTKYFEQDVLEYKKRMIKRTKVMCENKPTLSLIGSYTSTDLIKELLSLNFKGFKNG